MMIVNTAASLFSMSGSNLLPKDTAVQKLITPVISYKPLSTNEKK
jgi:hypothetical protein